jgi:acetyl-CoA synthetase
VAQAIPKVLDESNAPFCTWFEDGEMNVRTTASTATSKKATRVSRSSSRRTTASQCVTYRDLITACRLANGLKSLGVKRGDRVVIYMPMSIEGIAAMQACARIGVTHRGIRRLLRQVAAERTSMPGGRHHGRRAGTGGKPLLLKVIVDDALGMGGCDVVRNVVVYTHRRQRRVHVPDATSGCTS